MTNHRAGIAQAEVKEFFAICAGEVRTFCVFNEQGESPCPPHHPVHRNTIQQAAFRALIKGVALGMFPGEHLNFLFQHFFKFLSIDR